MNISDLVEGPAVRWDVQALHGFHKRCTEPLEETTVDCDEVRLLVHRHKRKNMSCFFRFNFPLHEFFHGSFEVFYDGILLRFSDWVADCFSYIVKVDKPGQICGRGQFTCRENIGSNLLDLRRLDLIRNRRLDMPFACGNVLLSSLNILDIINASSK